MENPKNAPLWKIDRPWTLLAEFWSWTLNCVAGLGSGSSGGVNVMGSYALYPVWDAKGAALVPLAVAATD